MTEALYIHENTALINFTERFFSLPIELLDSPEFKLFLGSYLDHVQASEPSFDRYLLPELGRVERLEHIVQGLHRLLEENYSAIDHPLTRDRVVLLSIVEDAYSVWRGLQRCSLTFKQHTDTNFIEADVYFNSVVLALYRQIQENVSGQKNCIFRQLMAGSNAALSLKPRSAVLPDDYKKLREIVMIDSVMLHSPLIVHPRTNKREGHFQEVFTSPLADLDFDTTKFFAYPARVGSLNAMIYVHRDFTFSAIALANLFELVNSDEMVTIKPDLIVLFGVEDGSDDMVFYQDKEEGIVIGKIAYNPKIEYFGYLKKITLTCYNVAMMARGWLPIHGSMVNVTFKSGKRKGVVFMGDSGAGKSETLEEMTALGSDKIEKMEVVFDDMGSFHFTDGVLYAQGTEVGAFVRLDDLDRGLPYKEMDRSIFMNPESSVNARVIVPASTYDIVKSNHPVDCFFYANNYDEQIGLEKFTDVIAAKQVFVDGKRMAKGTTHEVGLTTSFFANPFGPLQQEALAQGIIDDIFAQMAKSSVIVGQIFTHIGREAGQNESLRQAARAVLDELEQLD